MRILASAVGQYDNVGDTVLRRGFLDHLRTIAPLRVYVGDKTDDYISGLGLHADDIPVRDSKEWRRAVSKQLLTGSGVYAFDTGETEVQAAFAKRYLKLAPLLVVNRLRGGVAVQLGVGVRESTVWRHPIAAVLRLCHMVSWRDSPSRSIMNLGTVTPDWAFALGSPDELLADAERPRPLLAIAVRQGLSHAAREKPSTEWIDAVAWLAEQLGLRPVVLAQIERDGPLARELAARLGCDAVVWLDDNHARQEERLRAVYRDSAIVLSDRLHAVVIAATEGAVPIALSSGPMDKVTRTLEGAGIPRTSVARDLGDRDAALATIRDALGRRSAIMVAVTTARTRLAAVTDTLRARVHRTARVHRKEKAA
ncbi:MAG TPA: polysaccharide pyruvyl transferase family protein [Microbacterium sp.]|uniref:polysaccharide pyruvyl transferase family protein n=1 Tax=Microbacterium sp. TaxID=51671 RepID=UPI002BEDA7E8|nr:polysaccharide pyruvyl transferase family protein [Microbacterium sp.]HWI31653.1 polysaccharide pyruvyl transferase family protein [Microbacterium sp.]